MPLLHILFYLLFQGASFFGVHAAAIHSEPAGVALNISLSLSSRDSGIIDSGPAPSFNSNQRSIFEIVWGCLTTVFLCTWVAVHLDIPEDDENDWKILLRRIKMMCWTIMFPELVIAHAVRQFRAARLLFKSYKYSDSGWTMKHAHFERMGGFREVGHLTSQQMPAAVIQDKSKADGLSKIILITQSLWFVVQCIGRRVKGLDLSPLEVTTLALTVCTFMLSILWWDKPFDVRKPFIRLECDLDHVTTQSSSNQHDNEIETPPSYPLEVDITEGEFPYTIRKSNCDSRRGTCPSKKLPKYGLAWGPPRLKSTVPTGKRGIARNNPIRLSPRKRAQLTVTHIVSKSFRSFANAAVFRGLISIARTVTKAFKFLIELILFLIELTFACVTEAFKTFIVSAFYDVATTIILFICVPFDILRASRVTNRILFVISAPIVLPIALAAPIVMRFINRVSGIRLLFEDLHESELEGWKFGHDGAYDNAYLYPRFRIPIAGAAIFGFVHCISWNFNFPSATERTLWRISSVAVSVLMVATVSIHLNRIRFTNCYVTLLQLSAELYVIARCYLLVEGVLALRDLPPSALETLNWLEFLPHLS